MKKILFLAVFTLASAVMYAGGFRVNLQGNKSLAMGHTGVAVVNNAELVFHNPAGLVFLENRLSIAAGGFPVFSNVAYQNTTTGESAETDSGVGTPFYIYASYQATDWLAFGLGVYTPYGSEVTYPDDWAGSHLVNNIDLAAIYFQASAAIKVNKFFSFSAGFIFVNGNVSLNRNLSRTLTDLEGNRSEVTVDASGVNDTGWTVSALFNVTDNFRLGATYRSLIRLETDDATADFENIPNSPATPFEDTEYTVTITDENGCVTVRTVPVTVLSRACDEPFIFFPNTFSPNGDGENDMLIARAKESFVDEVYWIVYNRWGEKVFEANSLNEMWDGRYDGELVAPDSYGYYLRIECTDGDVFEKRGNVTVIR